MSEPRHSRGVGLRARDQHHHPRAPGALAPPHPVAPGAGRRGQSGVAAKLCDFPASPMSQGLAITPQLVAGEAVAARKRRRDTARRARPLTRSPPAGEWG
jgi:hypothetical protein